jgi:hypothetical protein
MERKWLLFIGFFFGLFCFLIFRSRGSREGWQQAATSNLFERKAGA